MASAPTLARPGLAFKSILFATDCSCASDSAASFVGLLAESHGSTIYAVHVLPEDTGQRGPAGWRWQFARASLESFLENHKLREFPHKAIISAGNIPERLTDVATDVSPDLVVLGTHGRIGVNKFMLGSIAEQVFRTCKCPVLTVGPHVPAREASVRGFGSVIFACDFSESCADALSYALALAQQGCARLIVVHAVDEVGLAIAGFVDEVIPRTELRLRKWVTTHAPDISIPWSACARFGRTASVILRTATHERAGLIVMGAQRWEHPGLAAHAISGTAYRVVASANCPVLTVRHQEGRCTCESVT